MTYKEMVQTLFKRSGMSVKGYAEALGYSVPQVSNVVNDNEPGSLKMVQAALRHAQIELEDCLDLPDRPAEATDERRLIRLYRAISDERKKLTIDLVASFEAAERVQGRRKAPK